MTQPDIEPMENPAAAARDVFAEANRANKQESAHAGEVLSGFGSSSQSRPTGSKAVASMGDIALFFKWLSDKSAKMPTTTRLFVIGAILYAIMPVDLIPDFIPGFGVIDDAVVLGLLIGSLRSMLREYREFMSSSGDARVSDLPPNL
jgi:uncharacterized membrane protein YkvA (DUF1232 family)